MDRDNNPILKNNSTSEYEVEDVETEIEVVYNPKEGDANSSTDGWWFQVHIDQTTDDMRKIANKLAKVGYNFVLLCCTTGKKTPPKAFGIISLLDLEKLADRLDKQSRRKKKPRD